MTAYYNEFDPYAAQWLRNLIDAGQIAYGYVDERSISDVRPSDLAGFTQCHFFAGIGVWSHALRRAGWPDDRPIWTGSCPCQPFSAAGAGEGFADERHLWPHWHHLIRVCRPPNVFGEQVASKDGLGWLDLVQADMEGTDYACWPVDLCAAGVGAPHIRQRLWFVGESLLGDADHAQLEGFGGGYHAALGLGQGSLRPVAEAGEFDGLGYPHGGMQRQARIIQSCGEQRLLSEDGSSLREARGRVGHNIGPELVRPGPTNGLWGDADWLLCRDGKWRPVEPGTFPLAHGATSRVGRLRAYGNAIVAQAAEAVISTYLEHEHDVALAGRSLLTDDFANLI